MKLRTPHIVAAIVIWAVLGTCGLFSFWMAFIVWLAFRDVL